MAGVSAGPKSAFGVGKRRWKSHEKTLSGMNMSRVARMAISPLAARQGAPWAETIIFPRLVGRLFPVGVVVSIPQLI